MFKDVLLTYVGFLFFKANVSFLVLLGISFSFLGASYYILSNYLKAKEEEAKKVKEKK